MNRLPIRHLLALCVLALPLSAHAMDGHEGHHGHHAPSSGAADHSAMGHGAATSASKAMGMGIVHTIDAEKRMVNLTHEPIPALNWPKMTMDLPVTKRVKLESLKAGDSVHFTLKMGRDKVYRITKMEKVQAEDHSHHGHHGH
ncbi:MAG: copper-binding protein [Magnetococcales bacterium]|nr:copper-binding protein [Magnetococcales bacterium]